MASWGWSETEEADLGLDGQKGSESEAQRGWIGISRIEEWVDGGGWSKVVDFLVDVTPSFSAMLQAKRR